MFAIWFNRNKFDLKIPSDIIAKWNLNDGTYEVIDQLYGSKKTMVVEKRIGIIKLVLGESESFILKM